MFVCWEFCDQCPGSQRGTRGQGLCFSAPASPALQADGMCRLGNNWMHALPRQFTPIPLSYGSGHREASCSVHVQFDTTSRNCKLASCPLRVTEKVSYFILIHIQRVSQHCKAVKCDEAEGICQDGASWSV